MLVYICQSNFGTWLFYVYLNQGVEEENLNEHLEWCMRVGESIGGGLIMNGKEKKSQKNVGVLEPQVLCSVWWGEPNVCAFLVDQKITSESYSLDICLWKCRDNKTQGVEDQPALRVSGVFLHSGLLRSQLTWKSSIYSQCFIPHFPAFPLLLKLS